MTKQRNIPLHTLDASPTPGIYVKHIMASERHSILRYSHRDNYYLFVLMIRGRAALAVDFENRELTAGEAMIISPSQVHYPSSASRDAELWMLALSPEHLSAQDTELLARYALYGASFRLECDAECADLECLFGMFARHRNSVRVAISLASSIRDIMLGRISNGAYRELSRYITIVGRFKSLLELHLSKIKSPSLYASMMAISEVYLNEAMKAVTGQSVGRYIRNRVVVSAKRHLLYTSMSMLEIALMLGYEDYAYFSRLFKKETGMSPVQYRQNHE